MATGLIEVSLTVSNAGKRTGTDTPQVYVAPPPVEPAGASEPTFRLVGWARVALEPGQSAAVRIICDELRVIASYDPDTPGWTVAEGRLPGPPRSGRRSGAGNRSGSKIAREAFSALA